MTSTNNIADRIQKRLQAQGDPEAEFLFSKAQNGDALFVVEALHDQESALDTVLISEDRIELEASGKRIASFSHDIGLSLYLDCQSAERVNVLEMISDIPHRVHTVTAKFV